ncbi:hypothetical protein HK104_009914 [Borealophlyctis nickersoniae]|nr:hypothetical protein HK104_009914 [Borealophlyctis nickersoniae]
MSAAESHKYQGNVYFGQQLYDKAIAEYSTAIIQNPSNPVYYTNRALCYLRTGQFERVISDCEKAVELDAGCLKGYYFACEFLNEKAYQLSIEQRASFSEEIAHAYRQAKKKKWEIADRKRRERESDLFRYLGGLVEGDRQRRLAMLSAHDHDAVEAVNNESDLRLSEITALFSQAGEESGKKREVPDYFTGKISFEIMTDPVITPSGITYDRTEILQHLRKIGQFDPLSRKPMTEADLIPNLSLKEAIDDFLDKNGWAVDY